ncbi:MAG TPA: lysophospholipid acyltransferase family protein [Spirochaetota bacterium]|nr:lysophospholipid acyltransferase family protein [Spirochaetota bacterium]HPP50586.1 lysophospholipid acyltransferase family protein [Spirochaetota bacterium]
MKSIINLFKFIWLFFWASFMSVVLFIPMTVAAIFSVTGNLAFNISKLWAWTMLIVTGVRVHIKGRETIKEGMQYVIISNHQSQYDILALVTSLNIQFRWVIKKELLYVPLFGWALYAAKNVFIDRSNREKAIASINKAVNRLPQGVSLLVFAEGTRSKDGTLQKFKKGGFTIAIERKMPILPVVVKGSRAILPKGSLIFHSGNIEVVVCDPIPADQYTHETIEDLINKTHNVIEHELSVS